MYCPFCGYELPDDAKFCQHCGKQMPLYNSEVTVSDSISENTINAESNTIMSTETTSQLEEESIVETVNKDEKKKYGICDYIAGQIDYMGFQLKFVIIVIVVLFILDFLGIFPIEALINLARK